MFNITFCLFYPSENQFSFENPSENQFSFENICTEGLLPFIPRVGDSISLSIEQKSVLQKQLDIEKSKIEDRIYIDSCESVEVDYFKRVEKIHYDIDSNQFKVFLSYYKKETFEVNIKLYYPEWDEIESESVLVIRLGTIPKLDEFVYLNTPECDYFRKILSKYADSNLTLPNVYSGVFQVKRIEHFLIDKSIDIYVLPCESEH